MAQAASTPQRVLLHPRECRESSNLDRRLHLRACGYYQEAVHAECLALHITTNFSVTLFEKIPLNTKFLESKNGGEEEMSRNQLNLFNS